MRHGHEQILNIVVVESLHALDSFSAAILAVEIIR